MNLANLRPAPWQVEMFSTGPSITSGPAGDASERFSIDDPMELVEMEFVVLARNAFDLMLRCGWSASIDLDSDDPRKWYAVDEYGAGIDCSATPGTKSYPLYDNPFSAVVETARIKGII